MNILTDTPTIAGESAALASVVRFPPVDQTAAAWWDFLAEPVRAVLDLAWLRGDAGAQAHGRILDLLVPSHVGVVDQLADGLYRLEKLENGDLDAEVGGVDAAEAEYETLRADLIVNAQLLASLIAGGVR